MARDPPYDVATAVADLGALRDHWGLSPWIILSIPEEPDWRLPIVSLLPPVTKEVVEAARDNLIIEN